MNNNHYNGHDDWQPKSQSPQAISVTSPGQLFANIPGLLGFYPQESAIFITLEQSERNRPSTRSGPILRMDLDQLSVLPAMMDTLTVTPVDCALVLIVSKKCYDDAQYLNQVTSTLLSVERNTVPIRWVWQTKEILSGSRYHLVYDSDDGSIDELPLAWRNNVIPDIAAARTTQEMISRGELPELNRQDCLDFFAPVDNQHIKEVASIKDAADTLISTAQTQPELLTHNLEQITAICRKLEEEKAVVPTTQHQHTTAVVLSRTALRDLVLSIFCTYPDAGKRLSLLVARNYPGVIRSNALCVYAMCEMATHNSSKTFHALLASYQDDPEHRLSSLLLTAYQTGMGKKILDAIKQGTHATYRKFGLKPPPHLINDEPKVA